MPEDLIGAPPTDPQAQAEWKAKVSRLFAEGKIGASDLKAWYKKYFGAQPPPPELQRTFAGEVKAVEKTRVEWKPFPNIKDPTKPSPQQVAAETEAFETLAGGAAGGGKSQLLLGLAATQHRKSLLLRRTFPDIERSLIEDSFKIYGDRKKYNSTHHKWTIGVRRIEFGHVDKQGTPNNPGDEKGYASAAYDFIGIDQLEQFSAFVYEFLFSRARTTIKGQRVRVVATANPVGEGVDWIIERWSPWLLKTHPNPAKSGEIRYFKRNASGKEVETTKDDPDAVSRTFVQSLLSDNPFLGDEYRRVLNQMREPWRSQLLYGDWESGQTDDPTQVIPRAWVEAAMKRWVEQKPDCSMTTLGMDISRAGDDQTVYAPRYDNWYAPLIVYPGRQVENGIIAAKYAVELVESQSTPINADVIGWGASACDHLSQVLGYNVNMVNFGESFTARDKSGKYKFLNKRAQYYWQFADRLDPESGLNIMLPPDPELKSDLCSVRAKQDGATIKCEPKEDIKQRIGRSPDKGDAVVLASIEPAMPGFRTLG
jgi:hypothetical protein